jgi:hypothetical protein
MMDPAASSVDAPDASDRWSGRLRSCRGVAELSRTPRTRDQHLGTGRPRTAALAGDSAVPGHPAGTGLVRASRAYRTRLGIDGAIVIAPSASPNLGSKRVHRASCIAPDAAGVGQQFDHLRVTDHAAEMPKLAPCLYPAHDARCANLAHCLPLAAIDPREPVKRLACH